jgi:hypothetical protein
MNFNDLQIVNGKLVSEKIISQLSAISGGDVNKLMDMYSTFDFCSNTTSITINKWLALFKNLFRRYGPV